MEQFVSEVLVFEPRYVPQTWFRTVRSESKLGSVADGLYSVSFQNYTQLLTHFRRERPRFGLESPRLYLAFLHRFLFLIIINKLQLK